MNVLGENGAGYQNNPPKDNRKLKPSTTTASSTSNVPPKTITTIASPTPTSTGTIPKSIVTTTSPPLQPPVTDGLSLTLPPTVSSQSKNIDESPTEHDSRVSWVYYLNKVELQQRLITYGLSTEGKVEELRKRLVVAVRRDEGNRGASAEGGSFWDSPTTEFFSGKTNETSLSTTVAPTLVTFTAQQTVPSITSAMTPSQETLSLRATLGLPASTHYSTVVRMVQEKLSELKALKNAERVKTPSTTVPTYRGAPAPQTSHGPTPISASFHSTSSTDLNFGLPPAPNVEQQHPIHQGPNSNDHANGRYDHHGETRNGRLQQMDIAQVCNQVRKWNLRFDGENHPISFIERLNELAESYGVEPDLLLKALPELFKGDALLWYRNNKESWGCYDDFLVSFEEQYLPPNYRRNLEEEISRRTQGENEPVRKFVVALTTLMRRRGDYTTREILDRLYSNLRPDYKLMVRRYDFHSVSHFVRLAEGYEDYLRDRRNFRPPPNPAQSMVPETAYEPRTRILKSFQVQSINESDTRRKVQFTPTDKDTNQIPSNQRACYSGNVKQNWPTPGTIERKPNPPSSFVARSQGDSTQNPQIPSIQPPVNQSVENFRRPLSSQGERKPPQPLICFNCERVGHRFSECQLPKVIRCLYCKTEGMLTTRCPCRAGNGYRDRRPGGVPCLEDPAVPPTSGQRGWHQ